MLVQSKQTENNCFNSKTLGNCSKSSNIVGLWMSWTAAATWILQLLLLEDSTQTLKMEPELHNTCTTLTVILIGRSWAHLSKYNNKLRQHAQNITPTVWNRRFYCLFSFFVCVWGFIAQHNRNQTHSQYSISPLNVWAQECRPVLNGNWPKKKKQNKNGVGKFLRSA